MSLVRQAIKQFLLDRDAVLSRPPGQFSVTAYKFRAAIKRGLDIKCVIDGGAAEGEWAKMFKSLFPAAHILMVEPRHAAQPHLRKIASELSNINVAQALLGPREETSAFNEAGHLSSLLNTPDGASFGRTSQVEMATIDRLVSRFKLPPPDLIKLDLQGYELEALRGASQSLRSVQMIFLEVSFVPCLQGQPLIGDVIPFMTERGFRLYDITGLWHRPLDGALGQGDFVFIRNDHPLVRDPRWDHSISGYGSGCD